jgi:hypothetical protein
MKELQLSRSTELTGKRSFSLNFHFSGDSTSIRHLLSLGMVKIQLQIFTLGMASWPLLKTISRTKIMKLYLLYSLRRDWSKSLVVGRSI